MLIKKHLLPILLVPTLCLWGCPDEDADEQTMAGEMTAGEMTAGEMVSALPSLQEIETIANELIEEICELGLRCPSELDFDEWRLLDEEICYRLYREEILEDVYEEYQLAQQGEMVYSAESARCMIDTLVEYNETQTCEDLDAFIEARCEGNMAFFSGTKTVGENCEHYKSCEPGLDCETDGSCIGTCVGNSEEVECETDTECVESYGPEWVCINQYCDFPGANAGESCEDTYCVDDLSCNADSVCEVVTPLAEGDVCVEVDNLCELGLVCPVVMEGTCQQPAQLDEECTISFSTPSFSTCDIGLYCQGINPESSPSGVCKPEPQLNEACGTGYAIHLDGGNYCPIPMACVDGLCINRAFVGQACSSDQQCETRICEGTCVTEAWCE